MTLHNKCRIVVWYAFALIPMLATCLIECPFERLSWIVPGMGMSFGLGVGVTCWNCADIEMEDKRNEPDRKGENVS